jgi:ketosteroid isomerase-like protein
VTPSGNEFPVTGSSNSCTASHRKEIAMSIAMSQEEVAIRRLIERWVASIQRGDLDGVLAGHDADIVMFDVPPPFAGVRGIDPYKSTWPPFFEWLAQGSAFELESLEVTAGSDVAFAYALLRCGTAEDFARNPDIRLRVTVGLRRHNSHWVVTHEHHSFPHTDGASVADS